MMKREKGGVFSLRFDRLGDFLLGQNIYLDEPALIDLRRRYKVPAGYAEVKLSFSELAELLRLARSLEHSCLRDTE